MATVRFSSELKSSIVANGKTLFDSRLKAANDAKPQFGDEIAAKALAPYMTHIRALPADFFRWENEIVIHRIGDKAFGTRMKLSDVVPVPRAVIKVGDVRLDGAYNALEVRLPGTDEYMPYYNQLVQWEASVTAVTAQRDEFTKGVQKVIEAHATLAPALKAWPPLWDLVPEEYKQRHRKVVERTKADEVELDIDLSKLTSTVVASKLVK